MIMRVHLKCGREITTYLIKKKKRRFKNSSDKFSKNAKSAFCEILSIEIINKMNPCHLEFSTK